MLRAIEQEVILAADGKLPEVFSPLFGHKVRILVLPLDTVSSSTARRYQTKKVTERILLTREHGI